MIFRFQGNELAKHIPSAQNLTDATRQSAGRGRMAAPGFVALLLAIIVGCSAGSNQGSSDSGNQGLRKDEAKPGFVVVYGMLIRKEPAPRSIEAYTGAEFYLHDPHFFNSGRPFSKDRIVLQPSNAVPREKLLKYNHVFVTVTVKEVEGTEPDPRSSYPTNPDGSPMLQGAGWQVLRILPGP